VRVEHCGEAARDAGVGLEQPTVLDEADELAEPLVELHQQNRLKAMLVSSSRAKTARGIGASRVSRSATTS
jgi:hypothetical protein